jgi:glutamate dehydrogenase/leucine dehydrogenase
LEILTRSYTKEFAKKNMIGPDLDIIGVEMGSRDTEMVWIYDSYKKISGFGDINATAITTNKPLNHRGV